MVKHPYFCPTGNIGTNVHRSLRVFLGEEAPNSQYQGASFYFIYKCDDQWCMSENLYILNRIYGSILQLNHDIHSFSFSFFFSRGACLYREELQAELLVFSFFFFSVLGHAFAMPKIRGAEAIKITPKNLLLQARRL